MTKLKKCPDCNIYTLKEKCPKCGSKCKDAHYKFVKIKQTSEKDYNKNLRIC